MFSGVRADPNFGDDSGLIEAMGYTRTSERKSGLTRKAGSPPPRRKRRKGGQYRER